MVTTFKDEIKYEGFKSMEASAEFIWQPVEFPESIEPARDDQDFFCIRPWQTFLKEYYEESINEKLGYIKSVNSENKLFQEIREKHHDNWEIVEMCREILFENVKLINRLQEGIENDRTEIKKLSRV